MEPEAKQLVEQVTGSFPKSKFKERYQEIFYEELLNICQKHYTGEQQERFIKTASFLAEVGPEKYSEHQQQLLTRVLERLVKEGFDQ